MTSEPDDILRAIIHQITGNNDPDVEPGHLLAQLDATQAAEFAHIAYDLTKDRYVTIWDDNGTLRLQAVE